MIHKIRMPKIDANVEEATVGGWLVEVGERVEEGDKLVEIITDKATFELETEQGGYLREKLAPEKSVLPVGYVLALVSDEPDEPLPDVGEENRQVMERHREQMLFGAVPEEPEAEETTGAEEETENRTARATPAARRLARREGVSIEQIDVGDAAVIREDNVQEYLRSRTEESD
jgi:pyruvate/2-oxoglutarate dehydrogenase complex dihydrolipoamide acyltransferase (E2) component